LPTNDSAAEASPPKATGVTDYGYRWYDPLTGRWLSQDPIGEQGGINLYGMIGNDAVNYYDEYGLKKNGHHIIPWSEFNGKVSRAVRKFFDSDVARIFNEVYTTHNFKSIEGISHHKYNELVREELSKFLGEGNLRKMTVESAAKFLNHIKALPSTHEITQFNRGIIDEAVTEITRKLGDEAAKAARSSIEAAYKSGAKVVETAPRSIGKKAGVVGFVVTAYFFVGEAKAQGVGNALFDEVAGMIQSPVNVPGTPLGVLPPELVTGVLNLEKRTLNRIAPKIMGASVCGEPTSVEFK
jgi:RHS repeat-associated protein